MRSFAEYNPIAVTLYFILVTGVTMFVSDPIFTAVSFLGAVLFTLMRGGEGQLKRHIFSLILFFITALVNPLVSHNGVTVLFFINDNPITLEAVIYGCFNALMIVTVLYWFSAFSGIMDSDKLLYVFGAFSPKVALVLSMALRYIPLFSERQKRVRSAQTAVGLYKDGNVPDRVRGGVRVFSIMTTWALEKGIVTADSMSARGYGQGRRSRFTPFRFYLCDFLLIIISAVATAVSVWFTADHKFVFYPALQFPSVTVTNLLGYAAYGTLVLFPVINDLKEEIRWRYLRSKI